MKNKVNDLLFKAECYAIIGGCFEVYKEKGCGFLEPVYQECMEIELRLQGIPYVPQKPLSLEYKGTPLVSKYTPDLICYERIVLELKAVKELADEHRAQIQNYLDVTYEKHLSRCAHIPQQTRRHTDSRHLARYIDFSLHISKLAHYPLLAHLCARHRLVIGVALPDRCVLAPFASCL